MKNITQLVVSFALLFLIASRIQAESVIVSSYVADQYLGFSTGSVLSSEAAVQTDVFMSFKSGFYADFFSSRSLKGSWNDGSLANELDYGFGWNGSIAKGLTMSIGTFYFDESRTLTLGAGDILKSSVSVSKDCKLASVMLGYENFLTMPNSGFHGGNMVTLGASRSLSVCETRLRLKAGAVGVYDFGTLGTKAGFIVRGNVGVDWNISKKVTLNVLGANWFLPLTAHDKRVTNAMVYTGVTIKAK